MNGIRVTAVLLGLLVFAGVAPAAEPDPEERLAGAYVEEVVEGKVAEAAKVYLDLLGDVAVPPRVRAEARFRFAVCATLLGRADEAQAHLAALLADAGTPDELKARAQEYARTVAGIGVGSELDRKLESLVFDLGRVSPLGEGPQDPPIPPVYRDFEIIGPAAVPFLRKLLAHQDLALRRHAYRVLVRMGADGMVEAWTPEIGLWGRLAIEMGTWLSDRPGAAAAFERALLALPDGAFRNVVPHVGWLGPLSEEFLRAVAARAAAHAPGLLERLESPERRRALVLEWVRSEDESLYRGAARRLLDRIAYGQFGEDPPPDLFPLVLRGVVAEILRRYPIDGRLLEAAVSAWADRVPAAAILGWLEAVFERLRAVRDDDVQRDLGFLAGKLGAKIEGSLAEPDVRTRYAAILLRRIEDCDARIREKTVGAGGMPPEPWFRFRLAAARASLPEAERTEFVRGVLLGEGRENPVAYAGVFASFGEEDLPVLLALWPALPPNVQRSLLPAAFEGWATWSSERARRFLAAIPDLYRQADPSVRASILGSAFLLLEGLPVDEAAADLVGLREATRDLDSAGAFHGFVQDTPRLPYFAAAIPSLVPLADEPMRLALLHQAVQWLRSLRKGGGGSSEATRLGLARVVLEHLAEIPIRMYWEEVNADPVRFPLEEWVPRVLQDASFYDMAVSKRQIPAGGEQDQAAIDRAAEKLAEREELNASCLIFIRYCASPDVAAKLAEALLRRGGPSLLEVHAYLGPLMRPEAVEAELARIVAGESPDILVVTEFAEDLAERRPSERLLPAVRTLLGTEDADLLLRGIRLAARLGRPESLPALAAKLDSLDPEIRTEAKSAMDQILELDRLRKSAKEQYGEK